MRRTLGVIAMLGVAAACHGEPLGPDGGELLTAEGRVGESTIRLTQTAEGLHEHRLEYDWTSRRFVHEIHVGADMRLHDDPTRVQILPGEIVWVTYYVEPRRHLALDATVTGARGEVCVTNTGSHAVRGLSVEQRVQMLANGDWRDVPGAVVTIALDGEIEAGGQRCLPYEVLLPTPANADLRVVGSVVESRGSKGSRAVAQVERDFVVPEAVTEQIIDAIATSEDGAFAACTRDLGPDFSCSSVFSLPFTAEFSPTSDGRWTQYPEGQYWTMFTLDIRNEGVCGKTFVYTIDAPLVEGGPKPPGGEEREMPASLIITTGDCEPPPPPLSNCVHPEHYWKQHVQEAGDLIHWLVWLGEFDGEYSKKISTHDVITSILARQGDASNGINELYAQLLTTKINIAKGANPMSIRETRNAADVFLASHDERHWAGLSAAQRQQVLDWANRLREFNEGQLGPPLCDEPPPPPPVGDACTRTIGYWKNHAGFGPQADVLSPLLPVWLGTADGPRSILVTTARQAVDLLEMSGQPSNGINKLYAQLLAAKLNLRSGANGAEVAATIAEADAFLATHDAASWDVLSAQQRAQVLAWMETLDAYNNGQLGAPHCK